MSYERIEVRGYQKFKSYYFKIKEQLLMKF